MKYLFTAMLLLASPASAQMAQFCDWIARADAIAEPWETNTRTFANGAVRLALLDTVEPAAGAFHVLILSPPYNELGERQCKTLGLSQGMGFSGADFSSLDAQYDPSVGLVFRMNVETPQNGDFVGSTLVFTLNQSTGAVGANLQ